MKRIGLLIVFLAFVFVGFSQEVSTLDSLKSAILTEKIERTKLRKEIAEKSKSTHQKVEEATKKKTKKDAEILKLRNSLAVLKTENDSLKTEKEKIK